MTASIKPVSSASAIAPDGAVTVPAISIPFSAYASDAACAIFATRLKEPAPGLDALGLRRHYTLLNDQLAQEARAKFPVDVVEETLGGVSVQRVIPRAMQNDRKHGVLINLHGGGFMWGAGSGALVEAIPVAAITGTTVIAVDYRMAPEHAFPAATQDVCAVYNEILRTHAPTAIGIYGCSAGAILTAQTIAWLHSHELPLPGAIAMLCGAGSVFDGDSGRLANVLTGAAAVPGVLDLFGLPYMGAASRTDPLAEPMCDERLLAAFPPTLLLTGSRDFAASSVTRFHRLLAAQGVDARLFMFDGLWHAFQIFCDIPESEEAHRILAAFFERTLRLQA